MKSNLFAVIVILFLFVTSQSCKPKLKENHAFVPVFSTYKSDSVVTNVPVEKDEIFYGLLTPVEICVIFNRLKVPFNDTAINPVSNQNLYLSSSKTAINTGIYGVDFGYLKMFGLSQEMINYMVTIREMSNKLGIPDYLLIDPVELTQKDLSEPDTIFTLMKKAYYDIEDELRKNGRESTAGLMVMGGWVEAVYIATQLVYDPSNPDPEVVQKIAEQKYTLTSLLSFMKNYYDDPVVVYYTKKLKYLKKYFDSFEIYFKKGDLEIDTNKRVFRASGSEMNVTVETLNKIRDYVSRLRTEMVTP
jgi:hypothetical protein